MPDLGSRSFRLAVAALLLVASFLVAAPALKGEVLEYDDAALLAGNPDLGEPGALNRSFGSFFTGVYYEAYLPVYGVTYWLDARLGADTEHPFLFRFQNVLWHAAAAVLAFFVLALLLGDRWGALFGALLFAVHPLHVESVAWIAERKDVVSGALLLLAWLCALKAEDGWRWGTALGLTAFLLACFAKASAVVLPALLVVAALLLPRYAGRRKAAAWRAWPYAVAAVVPVVVHLAVGMARGVVREPRGFFDSVAAFVAGWGGSIQRALVPVGLSIDYPEVRTAAGAELLWPGLLLLGAFAVPFALRKRAPAAAFGAAAFLVALLPFNNVFPATEILAADRYLYVPLFGLAAVAAWVGARWRVALPALAVAAAACLVLSMLSASRFVSDEVLWSRTLEAREDSALAYVNRGLARVARALRATPREPALLREAVADLREGERLAPLPQQRAKAALGMVVPLLELGDADAAFEKATRAIEATEGLPGGGPNRFLADAYYHRGVVAKLGRRDWAQAARDFEKSGALWSRFVAWLEAGGAMLQAGRYDDAKVALEKAAAIEPTRPEPLVDLAAFYRALDDRRAQLRVLDEAKHRAPGHREVVRARTRFWLDQRSPNHHKARAELAALPAGDRERAALEAEVDAQQALYLFRRGETEAALQAADRARAGDLEGSPVLYQLGHVFVDAGRYDDAVACYRAARATDWPERARNNAIARALALKTYRLLRIREPAGARAAMREALAAGADTLEAGAAPLREGELAPIAASQHPDLPLLAAAVVAGDGPLGRMMSDAVLGSDPAPDDRLLVYRLRALLLGWTLRRFAAAEDDLRQVLARDAGDVWARYRLAQLWALDGMGRLSDGDADGRALLEKSIEALGALVADHPDFPYARLQRGEARFALGDTTGAKVDYEALRESGFDRKEVYLKEAVLHRLVFVKGGEVSNLGQAEELLQAALARDPNYFDALFELGNIYHLYYDRKDDRGEKRRVAFARAILWYRRAMALNPRLKAPRLEWARICLKACDDALRNEEVLTAHQLVARLEEEAADVVAVHKQRARLNLRHDFAKETGLTPDAAFTQAAAALERVAALAPNDPELPALRALYHRTRGFSFYLTWARLSAETHAKHKARAKELAVREFKAAVAATPEDPENAAVRDRLRELAPDMILFDRQQAEAAHKRGVKAYEERRWQDAAAAFREALLLFPESTYHRLYLALSLVRGGRRDEAKPHLEQVANAPDGDDFPIASFELGQHYLLAKNRLVARVWFERYVKVMETAGRGDDARVARARQILEELGQ